MTIKKSRGNAWEYLVMERLQKYGYYAKRMGGTTEFFPDVIATSNNESDSKFLAIECKATAYPVIGLKTHDILKCFEMERMFCLYQKRYAILACKFMSKYKNTGFHRPIREHFYVMDNFEDQCSEYPSISVHYDGTIGFTRDNKFYQINPLTVNFLNHTLLLPSCQPLNPMKQKIIQKKII